MFKIITICDRCKKEFNLSKEARKEYIYHDCKEKELFDFKIIVNARQITIDENLFFDYNLCPDCRTSFINWINNYKENENERS